MNKTDRSAIINRIIEKINESNTIAIAGHVSPDGDAVASCLALAMSIKKLGKTPVVLLEEMPKRYNFMNGGEFVRLDSPCEAPDLFICCDCASKERIGKFEEAFDKAGATILIDHHVSNIAYGKINYIEPGASSASEMVYNVIDTIGNMDKDIASVIYAGILFDTGGFRFKSTSPETMIKVSKLMEFGIPFDKIYTDVLHVHSYQEALIFSKAVSKMKFLGELPIVYSVVTTEEMDSVGATRADLGGVVSYMLNTASAEISIFVSQVSESESKVSFRSINADVNVIAANWGGGGHVNAAGATLKTEPEAALAEVLNFVSEGYSR